MAAFIRFITQWIRPILSLAGNVKLLPAIMKACELAIAFMREADKQHGEGDGQFTKLEKAEWVKKQLREQTSLPDRWIDFAFGIAVARFITEKKAAQ